MTASGRGWWIERVRTLGNREQGGRQVRMQGSVDAQLRTQRWCADAGDAPRTHGKRTDAGTEHRTHRTHRTQWGRIRCMCCFLLMKTKPKPIEMRNLYTALNNMETLNNENDHIMVTILLHGTRRQITINAMIAWGATEDFIDKGFCSKYNIRTTQGKTIREVYLAEGQPGAMGPITHTAKVSMDIGSERELVIFQVANYPTIRSSAECHG